MDLHEGYYGAEITSCTRQGAGVNSFDLGARVSGKASCWTLPLKRSLLLIELCTPEHVVCVIKAAGAIRHPDLENGWIFRRAKSRVKVVRGRECRYHS